MLQLRSNDIDDIFSCLAKILTRQDPSNKNQLGMASIMCIQFTGNSTTVGLDRPDNHKIKASKSALSTIHRLIFVWCNNQALPLFARFIYNFLPATWVTFFNLPEQQKIN